MDFDLSNYLPVSDETAEKQLLNFLELVDNQYRYDELSLVFKSIKATNIGTCFDFYNSAKCKEKDLQRLGIAFKNTLNKKDYWIFINWYLSCKSNVVSRIQFISAVKSFIREYDNGINEDEHTFIKAQLVLAAWEEVVKIADSKDSAGFWESTISDDDVDSNAKLSIDHGVIVLKEIGDANGREGSDLARRYSSILNKEIYPKNTNLNIEYVYQQLIDKFPWAKQVIDTVCGQLALYLGYSNENKLPPLLLVGPPGCGKTHFLTELAKVIDLRFSLVPCAGTSDHGGLSAVARGWSSHRPCAPVIYMSQYGIPNPMIIIDELDKAAGAENKNSNGTVTGALLSMMSSSSKYYDQCLLAEVDLSHVNFMATANTLDNIPEPLLDRFNVIHMTGPKLEHFDVLFETIQKDMNMTNLPTLEDWEIEMLKDILSDPKSSIRQIVKQYKQILGAKALNELLPTKESNILNNIIDNIK